MARPRKDARLDWFTSAEMAEAGEISLRAFNILNESHLAPEPTSQGAGKRGTNYWDDYALAELAVAGALHRGGAELLMSARLSSLLLDQLCGPHNRLPSRLEAFLQPPANPDSTMFPWGEAPYSIERHIDRGGFWLHYLLRSGTKIYEARVSGYSDIVIEVVDRRFAFLGFAFPDGPGQSKKTSARTWFDPEPCAEIEGWERGKDASVIAAHSVFYPDGVSREPGAVAAAKKIEASWAQAYRNAVGMLRVNVSLAIRNAFDAVYDRRQLADPSRLAWEAVVQSMNTKKGDS